MKCLSILFSLVACLMIFPLTSLANDSCFGTLQLSLENHDYLPDDITAKIRGTDGKKKEQQTVSVKKNNPASKKVACGPHRIMVDAEEKRCKMTVTINKDGMTKQLNFPSDFQCQ